MYSNLIHFDLITPEISSYLQDLFHEQLDSISGCDTRPVIKSKHAMHSAVLSMDAGDADTKRTLPRDIDTSHSVYRIPMLHVDQVSPYVTFVAWMSHGLQSLHRPPLPFGLSQLGSLPPELLELFLLF